MTPKEEKQVKIEALTAGLKQNLGQMALEEVKLSVIQSRLLVMSHGKARKEMMKGEAGTQGNIDGMKLVIRKTKEFIKELEK